MSYFMNLGHLKNCFSNSILWILRKKSLETILGKFFHVFENFPASNEINLTNQILQSFFWDSNELKKDVKLNVKLCSELAHSVMLSLTNYSCNKNDSPEIKTY